MFKMNKGQRMAVRQVLSAYNSGATAYALTGRPGTGKTTVTGEVVRQFRLMGKKVAVLAATNTASLHAKAVARKSGWYSCVTAWGTAHRGLSLYIDDDGSTKESGRTPLVSTLDVVIVDEASMLSEGIVQRLLKQSKFVLFVGDKWQLPPVGESQPSAFEVGTTELTQVMRQDDKQLKSALDGILTAMVEASDVDEATLTKWLVSDLEQWQQGVTTDPNTVALCFTNQEAERLNRIARMRAGYSDEYVIGDRLIVTAPVYKLNQFTGKNKLVLATNEVVIVQAAARVRGASTNDYPLWSLRVKSIQTGNEEYITVLDTSGDNVQWIEFLNETTAKQDIPVTAKVKYAYALTTHRSQGQEWENVLVNVDDFGRCQDDATRKRLLYTAISRTKSRLSLYRYGDSAATETASAVA